MEHPVFMMNDPGGIIYVDKNLLTIQFAVGDRHEIKINTHKLLDLLESRSSEMWQTKEFEIVPMYFDAFDNSLMVRFLIIYDELTDDWAYVFRCDLIEALKCVECAPQSV